MAKRSFDIILSTIGIILLLPLFLIFSLLIIAGSGFPVFFLQTRVGKGGKDFRLIKFRTMKKDSDKKGLLTVGGRDPRITGIGYFLRRYKLDELPQLFNVLKGDMSLVGPRPEVRKYVDLYNEEQKRILEVRPGITDNASIEYFEESELLARSEDPEQTYIEEVMPKKIELNRIYLSKISVAEDLRIIFRTISRMFT